MEMNIIRQNCRYKSPQKALNMVKQDLLDLDAIRGVDYNKQSVDISPDNEPPNIVDAPSLTVQGSHRHHVDEVANLLADDLEDVAGVTDVKPDNSFEIHYLYSNGDTVALAPLTDKEFL